MFSRGLVVPTAPVCRLSSPVCAELPAEDMGFLLKWDHIGWKCPSEMLSCKLLLCPAWLSPLKIRLKWQPPTFMPIQSISPWAVVYFSFRFLCRSRTVLQHLSLGIANQPHVYTAATLTWCHGSGVPKHRVPPEVPNWRLFVRNFPLLCQPPYSLPDCLSPLPPYSSPSLHPILFLFPRPFSLKMTQFPFGAD